jgi:uncharacterized membrane protein YcaP (DUF421 family)
MASWIIGDWQSVGVVAGKATLMYATALVGLRLGERRTLAQWTIIDFATAVAMGAIVGRTAIADGQSWVYGATALVTLVVIHRVASLLRFRPVLGKLSDHRLRILIRDGEMRADQLRKCGLTENDVIAQLRQGGIFSLEDVGLAIYETKGSLTVVPPEKAGKPLVRAAIEDAVDPCD